MYDVMELALKARAFIKRFMFADQPYSEVVYLLSRSKPALQVRVDDPVIKSSSPRCMSPAVSQDSAPPRRTYTAFSADGDTIIAVEKESTTR